MTGKGGFLLGEYLLTDQWAANGRYDDARRENPTGDAEITDGRTLGVTCWAPTQVRLTLESQFQKTSGVPRIGPQWPSSCG